MKQLYKIYQLTLHQPSSSSIGFALKLSLTLNNLEGIGSCKGYYISRIAIQYKTSQRITGKPLTFSFLKHVRMLPSSLSTRSRSASLFWQLRMSLMKTESPLIPVMVGTTSQIHRSPPPHRSRSDSRPPDLASTEGVEYSSSVMDSPERRSKP